MVGVERKGQKVKKMVNGGEEFGAAQVSSWKRGYVTSDETRFDEGWRALQTNSGRRPRSHKFTASQFLLFLPEDSSSTAGRLKTAFTTISSPFVTFAIRPVTVPHFSPPPLTKSSIGVPGQGIALFRAVQWTPRRV